MNPKDLNHIYQLAAHYYSNNLLMDDAGMDARDYLKERMFNTDLAKELNLGYALNNWKGLYRYLKSKNINDGLLIESGLINKSEKGNYYDLFRGRIIFPIFNIKGGIIGFGGRTLDNSQDQVKYLNSPESETFKKRKELYGLNWAIKHVNPENPYIIITEGYFDALRLYEKGFKNSVAVLGTALTDHHALILKRYFERVFILFDGDEAGQNAALKAETVLQDNNIESEIITLEAGQDPGSLFKKSDFDYIRECVGEKKL